MHEIVSSWSHNRTPYVLMRVLAPPLPSPLFLPSPIYELAGRQNAETIDRVTTEPNRERGAVEAASPRWRPQGTGERQREAAGDKKPGQPRVNSSG
jgi:hypothetical protein